MPDTNGNPCGAQHSATAPAQAGDTADSMGGARPVGRAPWAQVAAVGAGDVLVADGGFTCLREGQRVTVECDAHGLKRVRCADGWHDLAGQVSDDGSELVGFYAVEA